MLTDLAVAARKSGLAVIELDGWRQNKSPGGEDYHGVLCHHTGSYDGIADAKDDFAYAKWLAYQGRSDLDPPLCNLALSAEGVVYVCAAGNANHAGQAKKSGPMPAVGDGNVIYIGIEAMNSGSQGWESKARTLHGEEITQYEAYVRLVAALCLHYGWPATHVRGHKETSVTGKVDPSFDMTRFRRQVAARMKTLEDDMPNYREWAQEDKDALMQDVQRAVLGAPLTVTGPKGEKKQVTVRQALARATTSVLSVLKPGSKETNEKLDEVLSDLDTLNTGGR